MLGGVTRSACVVLLPTFGDESTERQTQTARHTNTIIPESCDKRAAKNKPKGESFLSASRVQLSVFLSHSTRAGFAQGQSSLRACTQGPQLPSLHSS